MAKTNEELTAKITTHQIVQGATPPPTQQKKTLEVMFEGRRRDFGMALAGSGLDADRFVRFMITHVGSNPKLMDVAANNLKSLLGACLEIAYLGLDPSIKNEVYLIPYGNVAQAQCGYKGLAKLAMEAAHEGGRDLVLLRHEPIHENDIYEREFGHNVVVKHIPPQFGQPRGKVLGYYAASMDTFGKKDFREMTHEEVQEHQKKFSKAIKNSMSPFYNGQNFDAYGLKTVLRMLINRDLSMGSKKAAQKLNRALQLEDKAEDPKLELPSIDDLIPEPEAKKEESGEGSQL